MVDNNRQMPWFKHEVRFLEVTNSRLSEFQAAPLGSQLDVFVERHENREKNARLLHERIREIKGVASLEPAEGKTVPPLSGALSS